MDFIPIALIPQAMYFAKNSCWFILVVWVNKMLKLIALIFMIVSVVDVCLNGSVIGALCIFVAISLSYVVISYLMEELAVED